MNQTTANYDEPWKEALTEYFESFLYFFFPEAHQLISYQLSVISYQLSVTNWKQVSG
ncbi:Genome sequencing data, contig C307 (modular protein) [Microcystis aeruginosa PCC 9807]|uniref:Genome sequencing data, contig C307 (Modular protein) n=1 Tax=Microcystis aeruginosa PCC 9807 TaxID=1160283 RepID=I4HDQ1_MICAE|nr:hypothetical protein [Microcystis aeruginosa]CCI20175.1 Genome sequencing data, contig C307 (modular protein) [Microcystis aeruginosa PCC 9807]